MKTLLRCTAGIGACVFFLALAEPAWAVHGKTYLVFATAEDGSQFFDCFRFDDIMTLHVDSLNQDFTFAHDNFNDPDQRRWQSTTRNEAPFGISWHGEATAGFTKIIRGNAVNEFGDTFTFWATQDPFCFSNGNGTGLSSIQGRSPWRKRP